jgi:GGDEF domain-containing protein
LAFFEGHPLLGGIYTYLSITEIALLLLLIWLARRLASGLRDFEEAVERITFSNANKRIRHLYEADEEIQIEMFRSRHNHHPLSIILVEPDPESIQTTFHQLVQEVQQTMINGYVINSMAQTLCKYLRRTDWILEQRDQGRFIVLCPETNAADSKLLVEYIQAIAREQLGTSVTYGVATFPDQAITFEELVHQAELHLQRQNDNGRI